MFTTNTEPYDNKKVVHDYELLDYGRGRKLERFGRYMLDRPCPSANDVKKKYGTFWEQADCVFLKRSNPKGSSNSKGSSPTGRWNCCLGSLNQEFPERWPIRLQGITFILKRTPVGHVGIFPEQEENWHWLQNNTQAGDRVLNLFAYTGGSTIAAAMADPSVMVTHVDAAATTVQAARLNAQVNQDKLGRPLSIRWITEDAGLFVQRELRRKNLYDAVILDPPTYGHGAKGQVWKLEEDLPRLLDDCIALCQNSPRYILLSAHTIEYPFQRLADMLEQRLPPGYVFKTDKMRLYSKKVQSFDCGDYVLAVRE